VNYEIIAIALTGITLSGSIIKMWMSMNEELTKVKGRIIALEKTETEVLRFMEKVQDTLTRMDKLLSKHGIE
jgi:hypothetical protein